MIVIRTCGPKMTSNNGFKWPKQGHVECLDWNKKAECGNGLHGLLAGQNNPGRWYANYYLALDVPNDELVHLEGKVKFPYATVLYCTKSRKQLAKWLTAHGHVGPWYNDKAELSANSIYTCGNKSIIIAARNSTITTNKGSKITCSNNCTITGSYYNGVKAGNNCTINLANYAKITCGNNCIISTGPDAEIQTGSNCKITCEYYSTIKTTKDSIVKAKGGAKIIIAEVSELFISSGTYAYNQTTNQIERIGD